MPRDLPPIELHMFELTQVLRQRGWTISVLTNDKAKIKEVRKRDPATHESIDKTWFVKANLLIPKLYLVCLATLHQHKKPVPHLAPADTYKEVLGLPCKRRRRRGHASGCWTEEDEWATKAFPSNFKP